MTGATTVESSMEFPQKIKNGIVSSSSVSTSGYVSEEIQMLIQKSICTPMFIAALFTIASIWKQPKGPSIDK